MTAERDKPDARRFRPSEFMRARRPHLFSDTDVAKQAHLDRSTFEYFLETLTNRKQELDFEHFARKLAEREICPNLIPQTGPTGGGDSKVDSETYPVSSEISSRWCYATAQLQNASTERWAFAFSAKEDWHSKVRADIRSIASTGRGYSVAYFISSRFIKDKERAAAEDQLREAHGIDVRILDRSWIVDRVFTNRHERMAIETLRLSIPLAPVLQKGPKDLSREKELNELEQQIADPDRYQGLGYQLVEEALQATLLARGLELPRADVEGKFERASRLAEERGTKQQQLRCAYNKAWTYFWWYEDFSGFSRIYDTVQTLAKGSANTSDLQLLQNLWQLLNASVKDGHLSPEDGRLEDRTNVLRTELSDLQKEHGRPSAALYARANLLLMDLYRAPVEPERLRTILGKFREIFEHSKGLIDFPALQFVDVLMEVGEFFPRDSGFDDVFESAVVVTRERESGAASGRMLLRRGIQKLEGKEPYEAIRLLGRAQQDLALHECRLEMAAALGLCASAYEAVGLLWAARASMLLASNQALKEFWDRGSVTGQALACLRKLMWIELQLGRIPYVLAWMRTFLVLRNTVDSDEEEQTSFEEEWINLGGILGGLLLKTDLFDLRNLSFLPSVLESVHLDVAWMALLFALGYEDRLRAEKVIPASETAEQVVAFFREWIEQPAMSELAESPEFLDGQTLTLSSNVLGCKVEVSVPNNSSSLFLAEAVLAGLEGFLATSLNSPLVPHTSRLQLKISARDFVDEPLSFVVTTSPRTVIEIYHPKNRSITETDEFKDKLVELIATITAYIAMSPDGSPFVEDLIKNERGLGRAMLITNIESVVRNILGNSPQLRISDWNIKDSQKELFPLRRIEPWHFGVAKEPAKSVTTLPEMGKGEPPPELFDVEHLKHRDRKVFSLINMSLWSKAAWAGTGFIVPVHSGEPPFLALMFKDLTAGTSIFTEWIEELGSDDLSERLRVSIITGINSENPAAYRVTIGENPKWETLEKPDSGAQFVLVTRIQEMNPASSTNLDRFLESYAKNQKYSLIGVQASESGIESWAPKLAILKRELIVRPAWKIGRHDPDVFAINADDKVIIPDGVDDAPILETIAWKEARDAKVRSVGTSKVIKSEAKKIGRNQPCPCGSGKKYKKCHGK